MRNSILIVGLAGLLTSCGPYQKVLKNDDVKPKYELATQYYKEGLETGKSGKFKRAIRLLEQIAPQYRGKPQGEPLAYAVADSYYQLKDYFDAAYQFERFTKAYPNSDRVEDAAYKSAKSYYNVSPRFSLDQTDTDKALEELQKYIVKYPGGEHIAEANTLVGELRDKLEEKNFKIAELYYKQDDYRAAVKAMDIFIGENPGSSYREKAYFYKTDAQYTYAIKSYYNVMQERLEQAKKFSQNYKKYFPSGEYIDKIESIEKDINERLQEFN